MSSVKKTFALIAAALALSTVVSPPAEAKRLIRGSIGKAIDNTGRGIDKHVLQPAKKHPVDAVIVGGMAVIGGMAGGPAGAAEGAALGYGLTKLEGRQGPAPDTSPKQSATPAAVKPTAALGPLTQSKGTPFPGPLDMTPVRVDKVRVNGTEIGNGLTTKVLEDCTKPPVPIVIPHTPHIRIRHHHGLHIRF